MAGSISPRATTRAAPFARWASRRSSRESGLCWAPGSCAASSMRTSRWRVSSSVTWRTGARARHAFAAWCFPFSRAWSARGSSPASSRGSTRRTPGSRSPEHGRAPTSTWSFRPRPSPTRKICCATPASSPSRARAERATSASGFLPRDAATSGRTSCGMRAAAGSSTCTTD